MDGYEDVEDEQAEEDMTDDMRRGGGVASTSWMICIVRGWQR